MKILFLTRSFYPSIGGVEKHISEISTRLAYQGHRITIIAEKPLKAHGKNYHSDSNSARVVGKSKNIRIIQIQPRVERKLKKYLIWIELFKYWKVFLDSDVVHCHDVFYWYIPFRFLFPFKKVYTTFHGYEGNNIPNKKSIMMHKIAEKLSLGNICVGDFLKKWYGTKPTFVTYGAVSKKLIADTKIKIKNLSEQNNQVKNNLSSNSKKIIFVGRLEKETGVMTYLKALKILKDRRIVLLLDLYGEGSLEKEIIEYAREHKLTYNIKKPILNIESVLLKYEYVFCSRYLSILEGMASFVPVFAEFNNSIKEDYLKMSPFAKYISISANPKEIADSMEKYIKDKKMIDVYKAYEWVKNKDWEYMTDLYLKLWKLK